MNSIFTEENLLAFTTAARFGSFSKAAEELGLTTSAISYTIKRMETGLDVVLFTRSTRSIELTESGRYFFRKATDLLNDFHAIKRSIDTISQGIEARVRICINQLLYPIFIGIDLQFAINIQVRTADVLVFRNNRDSTRSDINISAECIVIAGQCHCPTVDTYCTIAGNLIGKGHAIVSLQV